MLQNTLKSIASTISYSRLIHFRSSWSARCCSTKAITSEDVFEQLKGKIYYSSYVEGSTLKKGYVKNKILEQRIAKTEKDRVHEAARIQPFPVALQHLYGEKLEADPPESDDSDKVTDYIPYENVERIVEKINLEHNESREQDTPVTGKWMSDYEFYEEDEEDDRTSFYGTPDPQEPTSNIPCGGCGALLHCAEPSIPGYLPSQLFKGKPKQQLMATVCQRCHFLKTYNTAINVTVSPKDYVDMISSIRNNKALVVLMVSYWI